MTKRILLVDDSSLARRTMRQMLETAGYQVEEAIDAVQALERYYLHPHDLVILDNVMDKMFGLEAIAKFKDLNPEVRIIMATADIQSSTKEQAMAAGAYALVNKPINREQLLLFVHEALKGEGACN
ncbi:MAG: response regulator receiver protein [Verrucomicrobiales bacterium]|nr:response regulator receiver protein [Verrucomicrobiales bacterium]